MPCQPDPSDPVRDSTTADLALSGLAGGRKTLPAKLFYDDHGCQLFHRITHLPEYYLTRTERALLGEVAPSIASTVLAGTVLVEYGASDEEKATYLLDQRGANDCALIHGYVAIDVAASALEQVRTRLQSSRPQLLVRVIATDFLESITLPDEVTGLRRLGFFPGSTIGNLEPDAARRFLGQVRVTLGPEARLLVGVDRCRDPAVLLPAYDDAEGVTAAFNLNLLVRLNREAGANFDVLAFEHLAVWNGTQSRIEMHLVSRRDQAACVAGRMIHFGEGETIHTENSYKYAPEQFAMLAESAGWKLSKTWSDPQERVALYLLAPSGR